MIAKREMGVKRGKGFFWLGAADLGLGGVGLAEGFLLLDEGLLEFGAHGFVAEDFGFGQVG